MSRSAGGHADFDAALRLHRSAWDELWRVCDVRVPRDDRVQLLLRLYIGHVLQVCSRHTVHIDAGVPARGLHGEAYRGHVFWDELYVYPFLNFRMPEVTRALLMYRYRRLGEARAAARDAGFRGAMFPWQSGSESTEETQRLHLNPLSGRWEPDLSRNQRHVNAAIVYNVWHHFQATQDPPLLRDHGTEMMLEIARFWASIAHFNPDRERYEIHGVMGPDEFHEKYPGAPEAGLRNNAYTHVLVAWLCGVTQRVLSLLPATRAEALRGGLGLGDEELRTWQDMSERTLPTTTRGPRTAPRSASSRMPQSSRHSTPGARGSGSWWLWKATSGTCRGDLRRRPVDVGRPSGGRHWPDSGQRPG